ncbi:MAG: phosphoribosyltransferase family protein [Acidobacteriota bacterium]|nr:phosphoribosyltransferase family protein [Blastocatellia bacterium]MDW8411490.1 phosphoribosyltransferase family protein [Acidobacteriota bacterium]
MEKARVIYTAEQIADRVKEIGAKISQDYKGQDLTVVGILENAFVFFADLIRCISVPVTCGFIYVKTHSVGGHTDIHYTSEFDMMGRNILLIGDVLDTGVTFDYLTKQISSRKPKSLKICVLIDKPADRRIDIHPDYYCFSTNESHIFGYGLGIHGMYRQYPYLAVPQ